MRNSITKYANRIKSTKDSHLHIRDCYSFPDVQYSPKQISFYSWSPKGEFLLEDISALKTISIPTELYDNRKPKYNLSVGYQNYEDPVLDRSLPKINDVLQAVKGIEIKNGGKLTSSIITSRGVLRDILMMAVDPPPFKINIGCLNGQLFMGSDNYRDKKYESVKAQKSAFTGVKFESILTDTTVKKNSTVFKSLIEVDIGEISVLFSSEVDGCLDPEDCSLANYVELKSALESSKYAKKKIYKALVQCMLSSTRHLYVGHRDNAYNLREIEEIEVQTLDSYVKTPSDAIDLRHAFKWLRFALNWIRESIDLDEKKGWELVAGGSSRGIELREYEDPDKVTQIRDAVIGESFEKFRKESSSH